jgi:peptidoglycan/LPS O-acetylase OafA/YrhL
VVINPSLIVPESGRRTTDMKLYGRVALPSIPALDGIRALSVLMVILAHLGVPGASGPHGVMAFFVLSGFLITWLLLKENDKTGAVSLRNFYMRRALRIFPAFYVFWIIYIVLAILIQGRHEWGQYIAAFFYLTNYYGAIVVPEHMAMTHTWSLGVEEQFYLLWPGLFIHFKDDLRRLTRILSSIIVAIWIYRLILYTQHYANHNWLFSAFDCRADHLAIGCLTAVLIKRRAASKIFAVLTANAAAPLFTLAALAGSMYLWFLYEDRYQFMVGFMLDPVLLAILMVQWIATSDTTPWQWLNSAPVRYLGRTSYSAYLYHWLVDNAIITRFAGWPLGLKVLTAVAGTSLLASGSYFLVERPFLEIKKRFEYANASRKE